MKKMLTLFLALLFALPLAACGRDGTLPPPEARTEEPREGLSTLPPPAEEEPETRKIRYLRVRADGLNVREGAGTGYGVLGKAQKDTLLSYGGKEGGWYLTEYRGKRAYIAEKYAEVTELAAGSEAAERVIRAGEQLLGTPYVYGAVRLHDGTGALLNGFTTSAFDCSSLMQYIFYTEGVLLGVTTRTQIGQGEPVAREDIARGDLLFFTNDARKDKSGVERVGHVALCLGGGYILHTSSDFAKIEPLSARRQSYFLGARRIL